jgi:malate dehydrogenase (oxaloacetate-decarboxylating)
MTTSEAFHDRFQLNTPFCLLVSAAEGGDPVADLCQTIRRAGARVADVSLAEMGEGELLYEMVVFTSGDEHLEKIIEAFDGIEGAELMEAVDMAMESHRGGACEMRARTDIESNTDLRIVYTPGVARVCKAIQAEPVLARTYTNIANKVAIATNGTAILGLGDIGPLAGLPVMEGKAAIFWNFARVSAEPVLIDTKDPDEFIFVMEKLACGFGAIQIEDVAAPECFRITRELDARLPIPVFHDDQHGTATIVLTGVYSALKKLDRDISSVRCAISGAGAAGTAVADLLMRAGVADVVLCDRAGAIYRGREENMNDEKLALAERTNGDNVRGTLADAMAGRDLFIGVSRPDIVTGEMVRSMAPAPIVLALANPVSEISRADALAAGASVYADGRTINNALAYPGIFRGALDAEAESITIDMMLAAANALSAIVPEGELMPEMMAPDTHDAVAKAVMAAAGAKEE